MSAPPQSKTSRMAEEAIPYVTGAIGAVMGMAGGQMGMTLGAYQGYAVGTKIAAEAHRMHDIYHDGEKDVKSDNTTADDPTKSKSNQHTMAPLDNIGPQEVFLNVRGISSNTSAPPIFPKRRRSHKAHHTKKKR